MGKPNDDENVIVMQLLVQAVVLASVVGAVCGAVKYFFF